MTRLPLAGVLAALLIMTLLCGCGGGSDQDEPVVVVDTGTIAGRVVRADMPAMGIQGAEITVRSAAGTQLGAATAGPNGNFNISNVPVGNHTVSVDTVEDAIYGEQTLPGVAVQKNTTTTLMVTVLRVDAPQPSVIDLTPANAQVDLNGLVEFTAAVQTSSGPLAATPTFYVTGGIGVVSYDPVTAKVVFRATHEGAGKLRAICGSVATESNITVVDADSPEVTSFLVAPRTLPATGGDVTITLAVNDGNGVQSVQAEIFRPDATSYVVPVPLASGTQETYRTTISIDANTNPINAGGQNPQTYSVRYIVTDWMDEETTTPTDEFVDITVQGLLFPPNP